MKREIAFLMIGVSIVILLYSLFVEFNETYIIISWLILLGSQLFYISDDICYFDEQNEIDHYEISKMIDELDSKMDELDSKVDYITEYIDTDDEIHLLEDFWQREDN